MSESVVPQIDEAKARAVAALNAVESALPGGDPAHLGAALQACDEALKSLPGEKLLENKAPDPADPLAIERARLWLARGRLLVMADQPQGIVQGLHSLDQAIARFHPVRETEENEEALITAWMNRGGGLFRLGERPALIEAVKSYEQAIGLMQPHADEFSVTLGAAWMNRGVGLMRLQDAQEAEEQAKARRLEAARSLEKAIELLTPDRDAEPAARRNLASSWANLGMIRVQSGEHESAIEAHREAVDLFRPLTNDGGAPALFELAARLFNLAQACNAIADTEGALSAGREALALATRVSASGPHATELALRSRHVVGAALAKLLVAGPRDGETRAACLDEADDLVEDGLTALAARGAQATPGELEAGARLYEFGAWLYRTQRPKFLGEFLLEHVGADQNRVQIAGHAVRQARQDFLQGDFAGSHPGGMERVAEILRGLTETEAELNSLSSVKLVR